MSDDKIINEEVVEETSQKTILLELENILINGRQIVFDVIKTVLGDKGVKLTPALFSRYCLNNPAEEYIPAILKATGKTKASEDKLAAEITQGIRLSFTDATLSIKPQAKKLIKKAKEQNIIVGALTGLDKETAGQIINHLGLEQLGVHSLAYPCSGKSFPSVDAWMKLIKNMDGQPSAALAITSNSHSCRSALASGMRTIVITDDYTSFQDFGGAILISEKLDEETVETTFSLFRE